MVNHLGNLAEVIHSPPRSHSSNLFLPPATLVNQLLQINPIPRPWEPPGSYANNIVFVEGCPELIAPSMWKSHMTLHAQDVFHGEVPSTWLDEQDLYVCRICLQLVSNRRQSSHSKKCNGGGVASSVPDFAGPLPPNPAEALLSQPEPGLPTFEDVCLLNQPTLRFIPSKSRPAFARALSSALRCVILENTEEAWLKLFMLPKCVLPSLRRKGCHDKPLPVDILHVQHMDG